MTQQPLAPHRGPGRPRKATPPRTAYQAQLAVAIDTAETRLDVASAAFAGATTVAAELELYLARVGVASAWAAFLRAQGLHTHALKYGEEEARFARNVATLRETLIFDLLNARKSKDKSKPAEALGKRKKPA